MWSKLNVGCPIYYRGWILNRWLKAVDKYLEPDGYIFVYTPCSDDTLDILRWWAKTHHTRILIYDRGTHGIERDWTNSDRIETLAEMRNLLLDRAAEEGGMFMSLDSDVVLKGDGFVYHAVEWDVVAPTVALATDRTIINGFSHRRPDGYTVRAKPGHHGVVDVLCAAKLMSEEVTHNVRYGYHPRGEDFYWSKEAKDQGYTLGMCTEVAAHYMAEDRPPIVADFVQEYRSLHA